MDILRRYFNGSYWQQLFLFGLIAMGSFFIFSIVGILISMVLYGFNPIENPIVLSQLDDPNLVNALRVIQLTNSVGIFVVPPLIFGWLKAKKPLTYFKLDKGLKLDRFFQAFLIVLTALPVINYLAMWNSALHLPEVFSEIESWMRSSEKSAEKLVNALLQMDSIGGLLFNLTLIAVIPAIGEELFFRGGLQQLLQKGLKNHHLAIWITAFLFSALHGQFLGFFPRFFLGALFGYLFYWSGNLWLPIAAHFANNGIAVVVSYMIQQGNLNEEVETVGSNEDELTFALVGILLMSFFTYSIYKSYQQKKPLENSKGS